MNTPRPIDDATAELLLTGGPVEADLEPLARMVRAYREVGHRPVQPSGELAARLATGVFTSAAGPDLAPVSQVNGRGATTAALPRWRRVRMALMSGLAAATAKIGGMSVAAKATAGLTIAAASMGGAGAAGALPDPVQDRFDTVVENVAPDESSSTPNENSEFGQRVSEDAQDGGVDGEEISEEARELGDQHRPDQSELPGPASSAVPDDPASGAGTATPGAPSGTPDHPDGAPSQRPTAAPTQP